jgi:putative membrane protein
LAFVDDLAVELFILPLVSLILVYTTARAHRAYQQGEFEEARRYLSDGAPTLLILGSVISILAVWGEFTWTLPGSYNILFDDVFLLLGIIVVSFASSILLGRGVQAAGLLSLGSGLVTVWYGINAYWLGMTKEPEALLALYTLYGLSAIVAYPETRILDRILGGGGSALQIARQYISAPAHSVEVSKVAQPSAPATVSGGWSFGHPPAVTVVFWILLLSAGLVAAIIGFNTIPTHLTSAP